MKDTNYGQVEKDVWQALVSIVTKKLLKRADENGYASLGKLTDSCVGMMDTTYSKRNEESTSGIHLSTREYLLSFSLSEDEIQLFSTAPYWIEIVGADSDPEPIQGAGDGFLYHHVGAMMERP